MMNLIRPELGLSGNFERWLRDSIFSEDPFRAFWGFDRPGSDWGLSARAQLAASLYEDPDAYYAVVELPGVRKDEVELNLTNSVLRISGKHVDKRGENERTYQFSRSLAIPEGVDPSRITAELKDGLLQIAMPKLEDRRARAIEVK